MAEYLDLNDDSKAEQLRHAEVLRKFEAHRRARTINVPTAVHEVKARLRDLGNPITLFGEDHADRRERLREVIAKLELDQEQLDKLQAIINQNAASAAAGASSASGTASVPVAGPTIVSQDKVLTGAAQKEVLYSNASEHLVNARREIAAYSFARAQQRLRATKRILEEESLEAEQNKAVLELYSNSKNLTLNASQIGDERPGTYIRYNSDGQLIAGGSFSGVVKIWDTQTLGVKTVLRGTLDRITGLSWHPSSSVQNNGGSGPVLLAAASAEGSCLVYDYRRCSDTDGNALHSADEERSGMDVDEVGGGEHVHRSGASLEEAQKEEDNDGGSSNGSMDDDDDDDDNDGGGDDGNEEEYARRTGAAATAGASSSSGSIMQHRSHHSVVLKLKGHKGMMTACEWHPSGNFIATGGHDTTWRMWDAEHGRELLLQDGHAKDISGIAFHPDGSLVMTSDAGGVALLWDIRSGLMVQAFQGHIKKISAVSFSANGFHAASSSLDNTAKIWDLRRKKCLYTLPAHTNILSDLRYSKSGELLLTSSFDHTVKVWCARDFHILRTLAGHNGKVMSADFSPDEKHVISSGYDRTIKLWAHKDEF
jgi:WD40 repeat protein